MEVKNLKWFSAYLFLGAILSFADPFTDILTLVEFYRTGHKTCMVWCGAHFCYSAMCAVCSLVLCSTNKCGRKQCLANCQSFPLWF